MHNVVSSDVILEILVRLSVKSLSRFKCVSKLWFSLISDPGFIRRHVELATIDKDVEHERRRLVFIVDRDLEHEKGEPLLQFPGSKTLYHVECDRVLASNDVTVVKLDCPILIKNSLYKVKFIGSCNGLLCFCLGPDSIFLLNPATKELRRLPNLNINVESSLYDLIFRESIYGFGYDPSLDDYHVIKISYESIVHVYSLKADTWRRGAQSFSYNRFNSDPGVALNGAVHWMFGLGKNWLESVVWLLKPKSIIAFDFGKGTFRELPRPSEAALYATSLGVLGGCLCLLNHSPHMTMMQQDFWIMKEYGVKESWAKVVIGVSFMDLRPLSYLKNDEVVLEMDGRLVVYNPREHTHKEVVVRGIHGRGKMGMETYVESLVSPIVGNSDLESVENL